MDNFDFEENRKMDWGKITNQHFFLIGEESVLKINDNYNKDKYLLIFEKIPLDIDGRDDLILRGMLLDDEEEALQAQFHFKIHKDVKVKPLWEIILSKDFMNVFNVFLYVPVLDQQGNGFLLCDKCKKIARLGNNDLYFDYAGICNICGKEFCNDCAKWDDDGNCKDCADDIKSKNLEKNLKKITFKNNIEMMDLIVMNDIVKVPSSIPEYCLTTGFLNPDDVDFTDTPCDCIVHIAETTLGNSYDISNEFINEEFSPAFNRLIGSLLYENLDDYLNDYHFDGKEEYTLFLNSRYHFSTEFHKCDKCGKITMRTFSGDKMTRHFYCLARGAVFYSPSGKCYCKDCK